MKRGIVIRTESFLREVDRVPKHRILFGVPLWGLGVYKLQRAINRLADQSQAERRVAALPPAFS